MIFYCEWNGKKWKADTNAGIDISLSFGPGGDNPNAFGIPLPEIEPIAVDDFVGSVASGSGANCDIIRFCAHGNTTHTECIGHITAEHENVGDLITDAFLTADLITVPLIHQYGDLVVDAGVLKLLSENAAQAIIIRTLPNAISKKNQRWSGNNPPYFTPEALELLRNKGYNHLLTDLPSVDPESDNGALKAHHVWWNYPANPRNHASITELIYVPESTADGLYLLNLQFPKIMSDASPSKPIIFPLTIV